MVKASIMGSKTKHRVCPRERLSVRGKVKERPPVRLRRRRAGAARHVRTLAFTELVPHGVEVDKLVKAAECGSVTADLLVGTAAKAKRGDALLLAWPAFVELADDVAPAEAGGDCFAGGVYI
jgi:hypothetical protein